MLSDKNKIKEVIGRKVYNSQGFATIEVEITLENGLKAWASAPRGSTKGNFETTYVESYINGIERTPNIDTAIANINNIVAPALKGKCFKSIEEFDKVLVSLDKTDRKKIIGGNCTLAASYAMLKLLSLIEKKPIYKLFNNISDSEVLPIFNMIDGSKHPKSCLNGVEILLIPKKDKWHNNITKLFDAVSLINSTLKELLIEENYIVEVSNQGALSILEDNMEKCLEYLKLALEKPGIMGVKIYSPANVPSNSGSDCHMIPDMVPAFPVLSVKSSVDGRLSSFRSVPTGTDCIFTLSGNAENSWISMVSFSWFAVVEQISQTNVQGCPFTASVYPHASSC